MGYLRHQATECPITASLSFTGVFGLYCHQNRPYSIPDAIVSLIKTSAGVDGCEAFISDAVGRAQRMNSSSNRGRSWIQSGPAKL